MKISRYLKDKMYFIISGGIVLLLIVLILEAFKISREVTVAITFLFVSFVLINILIDYLRKHKFYTDLLENVARLDKAYLVLETIEKPEFYEGDLLVDALYEINKSMCENVRDLENQEANFKEYIEMWIHEVKIPISALILMLHNHKSALSKKALEQISKIEYLIEEVLYYERGENAEKDYLISAVSLSKIISSIAIKNKDLLLSNEISLETENLNIDVYTDSKWLEFIVNQIVNNSVKYSSPNRKKIIKISAIENDKDIELKIYDNGIGIKKSDIGKVFEKSFTGSNGRIGKNSTGMGLFISKALATKLGHTIFISSLENEWTLVTITFKKNEYLSVVK